MQKIIIITVIITTTILISIGVILWQAYQIKNLERDIVNIQNEKKEVVIEKQKSTSIESQVQQNKNTEEEFVYVNKDYGFSLVFPPSWGKVRETVTKISDPKVKNYAVISLVSDNKTPKSNITRILNIHIAKVEDKDHWSVIQNPSTPIIESDKWVFSYSSSGSYAGMPGLEDEEYKQIQDEAGQIIKSFKLLDDSQDINSAESIKKVEIVNSTENSEDSVSEKKINKSMDTWNEYRNNELSFKIKFPQDWRYIDRHEKGVMLGPREIKEDTLLTIITIDEIPQVGDTVGYFKVMRVEDLTFAFEPAKRIFLKNINTNMESSRIIVQHNDKILSISEAPSYDSNYPINNRYIQTINRILATFRFLE